MKKKCIIVIPVYKDAPNNTERASFFQALNILKNHDICIITHNSCNLTVYKKYQRKQTKATLLNYSILIILNPLMDIMICVIPKIFI